MKKTIYIFNLVAALAITAFSASSCLDKYPADAIPEEEAMSTFDDAEQTLTGIYAAFKSIYTGNLILAPDIQADLVYAVDGNTNTYGDIWQWKLRSTTPEVESVYASLYAVIGRCNFYLDRVDAVRATLIDDTEIDLLDGFTGEVYCARALAYSELAKFFCKAYEPATAANELGVVLRTTYFGEERAIRASLEDTYRFILSDLEKAESLLDEDDDAYNNVYLSKAAAYALHARVALYMQDWDAAIKYAGELIGRDDVFELADATKYFTSEMTYYDYLWNYDSSFEIIWKIGYTVTSYGSALGNVFLHFNTDYTYYYPDFVPASSVLASYATSDLRYDAIFANLQTGYSHGLTWPLLVKYYGNRNFINNHIFHVNMPKVFRLSEQYLIRAEAYCRKGNYSAASADITALRKARYSSGGAASLNADNWLGEISAERVRELYMEGFRLQDLKRWHLGFERTPQANSLAEGSSLKVEADNPMFVWPIPKHELEAPGSEIQPNESNR